MKLVQIQNGGKRIMAREMPDMNPERNNGPVHDEISARAYQIFLERGCPEGRDLEHWLEAEAQLNAAVQKQPEKQTTSAAKTSRAPARQTAPRRV
jgi:hypothetical protein